ncbi:DnaJ-domain-containing protein [Hypoxylon sp. FL1150]|nr:DnaJ-domain-containing protein [Hypoxylon sp. FL1150]
MPPQATFDYYATLEVGKTAALQEIKDSYRRLALVHHPDKNPDDPEAATAAFQKIQTAYETLSDQSRRAKYDARTSQASQHPSSAGPSSSPYPWESDDDDGYDLFDDGFPISTPFGDFISDGRGGFRSAGFGFGFFGGRGEPSPFGGPTSDAGRAWRDAASEMLREEDRRHGEDRRREKEREEKIKEREERLKEEAAKKQKKEEAKKEAEAAKIRVRDESRRAEQLKQETRWEVSGAKTEEDKLEACLHSEYCVKISQQKKFKCGACGVKRGITAFKCPYCSLLLCQQCVVTFTKKRASAENPRPAQTTPTFKPQTEPELATQPEEQESDQESVADLISGFKQRQQKNAE